MKTETLITIKEAARRLGMALSTFYKWLPELKAQGLKIVALTNTPRTQKRVTESSVEKLIKQSVTREIPLVSVGPSGIGGEYQTEINASTP